MWGRRLRDWMRDWMGGELGGELGVVGEGVKEG